MNKADRQRIQEQKNFVIDCTLKYMCKKLGIKTNEFLSYNWLELNGRATIFRPVKDYFDNLPKPPPPILDTLTDSEFDLD
jgi:hypothetical protein